MQQEFAVPDFIDGNSAEDIHRRMMNSLPDDIDDMPGGFPYDFTMPAAVEKAELINYHLVRALMIAFPQYAWDEWLDLHGQQVHLTRHGPARASGSLRVSGLPGTEISLGTVFCTQATDTGPAIGFMSDGDYVIGSDGTVEVQVTAVQAGQASNVKAGTILLMERPLKGIMGVTNPESVTGGTERESDDDFYDRIAAEYANSRTYLGNDSDFVRWAKEAGAGGCVVMTDDDSPGVVNLVLTDGNGQPANERLIQDVYDYIVSPADRGRRLLPCGSARLVCTAALTVSIDYECTGLLFDGTVTSLERIKADFADKVKGVYEGAKREGVLRYNDVRPLMSMIDGVEDFEEFLVNGAAANVGLRLEEYPETGVLDFR